MSDADLPPQSDFELYANLPPVAGYNDLINFMQQMRRDLTGISTTVNAISTKVNNLETRMDRLETKNDTQFAEIYARLDLMETKNQVRYVTSQWLRAEKYELTGAGSRAKNQMARMVNQDLKRPSDPLEIMRDVRTNKPIPNFLRTPANVSDLDSKLHFNIT